MAVTTQELLSELATAPVPSASIASGFNISGFENNALIRNWCMLANGLFLINRDYYKDFDSTPLLPEPSPYRFSSPTFDNTVYDVRIDLELDNFNLITNYQRDSAQPFNGVTAEPLNLADYTGVLGNVFDNCT